MDIFSTMAIVEKQYYKIILVNPRDDTFELIKMRPDESHLSNSFSRWWKRFLEDGMVHPGDALKFEDFLSNLRGPSATYYRRKDGEDWTWTFLEVLPYEENFLIFIRIGDNIGHRLAALETLEFENYHDPMTKVRNRRAYELVLYNISDKANIIYLDLDDLKIYNDTKGHDSGDKYIIDCIKILNRYFRRDDIFRIGGDEFIVITQIPQTKFENNIEELRNTLKIRGFNVSIGIAHFEGDGEKSLKEAINEAEQLMYKEKKTKKTRK